MWLVFIALPAAWAGSPVEVRVNAAPLRFEQTTTTHESTMTITGPNGSRTVHNEGSATTTTLPGSVSTDTESHSEVDGAGDPGLKVETNVYQPLRPVPVIQPVGGVGTQVSPGAQGSVDTKSSTTTRTTPGISVQIDPK